MTKKNHEIDDVNFIELTDSYKVTHWKQLPPGTKTIYSFFESRGGKFPTVTFFGLQYYLKKYLMGIQITPEAIDEAEEDFALHFSGDRSLFNRAGWEYILHKHGGKIPVLIKAVPEGTTVPTSNVLMTVESTDPEVPWITSYIETLLTLVWYPCTIATQSRALRRLLLEYLEKTGDPSQIDFKMIDFGFRGSTSPESAGIGSAANLLSFRGTDTLQGTRVARKYYNERMAGHSIPAAEHSTITAWGKGHEKEAYEHNMRTFSSGPVAMPTDSYDTFAACQNIIGEQLKDLVLEREGVLIPRLDSGFPPDIDAKVLEIFGNTLGMVTNPKGYKVINPKVRPLQSDGIDYAMVERILQVVCDFKQWSLDNLNFGSGGGLLQNVNRDTQKFAYKCSAIQVVDEWRDVMKDPATDPGKRSKAGRMALVRDENGIFRTVRQEEATEAVMTDELVPVFRNGELLVDQSFAEIRERALQD